MDNRRSRRRYRAVEKIATKYDAGTEEPLYEHPRIEQSWKIRAKEQAILV